MARDLESEELPVGVSVIMDALDQVLPEELWGPAVLGRAAAHLRRPFTPAALRFKVQTAVGDGRAAIVVAYIDSRLVTERLNAVVAGWWTEEFKEIASGLMMCKLSIAGVAHYDVGEGKTKGLYSDAFKRAAVKAGVGVSVYALPATTMQVGAGDDQLRQRNSKPIMDTRSERSLRRGYANWLKAHGEGLFGAALDHGDVEPGEGQEGAQGDPDVVEGQESPVVAEDAGAAPQPRLEDDRAKELEAGLLRTYREVKEISATALLPAEFNRRLRAAAHSHEEMERLGGELEVLRDRLREEASNG